jgi:hypothetical protein
MAFPREAFVSDPPFPPEPESEPELVPFVTEDIARSMIRARIDIAAKRARSFLRRTLYIPSEHPLFSISYGKPPYILDDSRTGQGKAELPLDSDLLQQIALEEMKRAGLDEAIFTILSPREPRGNGTFGESREYPSQTIKGLTFGRRAYQTEDGSPTFVGWAVKG